MKIEHVLFPSVLSKLRIHVSEGHFQCVHTILFLESTKIGFLKRDCVNGTSHDVIFPATRPVDVVKKSSGRCKKYTTSCNLELQLTTIS